MDEQKLAFWTANEKVENDFSFDMKIRSSYPFDAVRVPNQAANVQQLSEGEWTVQFGSGKQKSSVEERGGAL